jgi:branched-chain amino acid transport system ATP-binding protein
MVAIGRALMTQPALLMLDEPSLGLAPRVVESIFEVVREINRAGVSIFVVEQNVQVVLALAHRAYLLEGGRVVREGPGPTPLADPDVRRAYLGPLSVRSGRS